MFGSVALVALVGCGASPPAPGGDTPSLDSDASAAIDGSRRFDGAWELVRIERRDADGELVAPPDTDRLGYLIYHPGGYMGVTLMRPDRPLIEGDEPTPEEALAAVSTYTSYFGTFTVNEAEGFITHHLEGSLNTRGAGSDYQRFYRFSENALILQPPVGESGIKSELTWERLPDLPQPELTETHRKLFGFYRIESVSRQTLDGETVPAEQYDNGYVIYAPSGHMSVHLMRPGRRPPAGERRTPDEALEAARTYASYFGPFSVNEEEGYLVHHRIGSENPGGSGSDAQRFFDVTDTHLTLRPPVSTDDDGRQVQSSIRWERITPQP